MASSFPFLCNKISLQQESSSTAAFASCFSNDVSLLETASVWTVRQRYGHVCLKEKRGALNIFESYCKVSWYMSKKCINAMYLTGDAENKRKSLFSPLTHTTVRQMLYIESWISLSLRNKNKYSKNDKKFPKIIFQVLKHLIFWSFCCTKVSACVGFTDLKLFSVANVTVGCLFHVRFVSFSSFHMLCMDMLCEDSLVKGVKVQSWSDYYQIYHGWVVLSQEDERVTARKSSSFSLFVSKCLTLSFESMVLTLTVCVFLSNISLWSLRHEDYERLQRNRRDRRQDVNLLSKEDYRSTRLPWPDNRKGYRI